uniref:Uncharacterized protein n=1 Tax=Mastacembelus armatus TaxID=205130 RepID=A0A7N8XRM5_9TELE
CPQRRLFTLAHNASLLPLAKAPADRKVESQVDLQPISYLSLPPPGALPLASTPVSGDVPLTPVRPVPAPSMCADIINSCLPIGHSMSVFRQQTTPMPLLLPLPSLSKPETVSPRIHCSSAAVKPGYFLLQMVCAPPAPPIATSQHAVGQELHRPIREEYEEVAQSSMRPHPLPAVQVGEKQVEEESSALTSTLSPLSSCAGEKEEVEEERNCAGTEGEEVEESCTVVGVVSLNGGGEEEQERQGGGAGGGGEEEASGGGEGEQGGEGEEEEEGQREDGEAERGEDGEKDKDEDQDRQGEEEEEEDFDDLTQDEDEEEVMSSASEESVLSVPELQVNRKSSSATLLSWLQIVVVLQFWLIIRKKAPDICDFTISTLSLCTMRV